MKSSTLYNEVVYKPQIPYVVNNLIYEYDLSKANISSLRAQNIIDDQTYQRLYNADRETRQVEVGLMIRDDQTKTVGKLLKHGIWEAKKELFQLNQIQDWEVLTIKNDAIFVIGRELNHIDIGPYYHFKKKNVYTIFMQLCDLELYYFDQFKPNGQLDINIDIKGIGDELIPLHENGMIELICNICNALQRDSIENVLSFAMNIYQQYIHRQLPKEYYREFNYNSKYTFCSHFSVYYMDDILDSYIPYLDINRNLLLLRELMEILSTIYNSKFKRTK